MSIKITVKEQAQKVINDHDTFLFDCDGVLWRGNTLLPHAAETIELLRQNKKQLIFVTNNSTKSRQEYTKKFEKLGIKVTKDEIFSSSFSAAVYLNKVCHFDKESKKVLVMGEKGLETELQEAGFQTIGGTDPSLNREFTSADEEKYASVDPTIGAVVCGLDHNINYLKLAYMQAHARQLSLPFLATNIDSTFPSAGRVLPGAGTCVKAVSYCSDREPDATLGKPSREMMNCIKANFELDPKRSIMVGDRLNTDMAFGAESGLDTLFVATGIDKIEDAKSAGVEPTYHANKLGDLYELTQ